VLHSVSDIAWDRLSEPARWTLRELAAPLSEGFFELGELCRKLGIDRRTANQALTLLYAEIAAQSGGHELPDLAEDEYEVLRDSIAEYGQLVEILTDGAGNIIDGHHRLRACLELRIEPQKRIAVAGDTTADERRRLALVVNVARRQVQASARRGILAAELVADPSRSDRAIAATAGVHHSAVNRMRHELEAAQQLPHATVRVGLDGVERRTPARRQRPTITCPSCGHAFDPIEEA